MAGTFRVPCVTPTPNPLPTASVKGYSTKTGPVFPAKPQSPARAFRLGARRHVAANASLSSTNANVQQSLSSAEDKQSAEDLQTAASTSNKNASAVGVVVTSQANFLRVVVRPEGMTQVQSLARTAQLQSAMDAAVAAGKLDDAERLSKKMNETGPFELLCIVRALLKKIKRKVLVGDDVDVTGVDWVDQRAMVHDVFPRKSALVDPPVANVDRALLVFACDKPLLEAKQLTRFLVSMEATKVPFDLVLNKADLISDVEKADWTARLEQWGYAPIFVSVATGEGVDELETYLARKSESVGGDFPSDAAAAQGAFAEERSKARDDGDGEVGNRDTAHDATGQIPSSSAPTNFRSRVTVLAGPSGVGKSSLINRLRAGSALAVALQEAGEFDEVECEEGDLDLDGEDDDGDDEDEGTGTSESYNSATGTSDEDTTATGTKKTVFRKQKNRFITDVDISGGGGGARGSLSLVMKSGVELQSVKSVSAKLGRGRHTTRHVTLLPLKSGGLLADTPGFGYPSLESLTVKKMTDGEYFPEIRWAKAVSVSEGISETGTCKFSNCTHRDEPGCVVDLVMPWEEERYDMYCDVFDEVSQLEKAEREAGYKRETRVRYKDGGKDKGDTTEGGKDKGDENVRRSKNSVRDGAGAGTKDSSSSKKNANRRMEPKLETKSNRRQSRRAFNMETADMEAASDGGVGEIDEIESDDGDEYSNRGNGDDGGGADDNEDDENSDWRAYANRK